MQLMHELFVSGRARLVARCALAGSLLLGLYVFSTPGQSVKSAASMLVGQAVVIDGDTLDIGTARIRLEGIDAPELGQSCATRPHSGDAVRPSGGGWKNAGRQAATALRRMIGRQPVVCRVLGTDRYGRSLASCRAGQHDLNAEMVRNGWAWAFVRYSTTYVDEERAARRNSVGVWRYACEPAWAFRSARWQRAESNAPAGCAIKGNISRAGRLYHVPWSPWCARTRINPARGERWFCNEREALDAGWQPARPQS